jgi:hypothetical protein
MAKMHSMMKPTHVLRLGETNEEQVLQELGAAGIEFSLFASDLVSHPTSSKTYHVVATTKDQERVIKGLREPIEPTFETVKAIVKEKVEVSGKSKRKKTKVIEKEVEKQVETSPGRPALIADPDNVQFYGLGFGQDQ